MLCVRKTQETLLWDTQIAKNAVATLDSDVRSRTLLRDNNKITKRHKLEKYCAALLLIVDIAVECNGFAILLSFFSNNV